MYEGTDDLDPKNLSSRELLVVLFERVRVVSRSIDKWQAMHDEHTKEIETLSRAQEKQEREIAAIDTRVTQTEKNVEQLDTETRSLKDRGLTAAEAVYVRELNKHSLTRTALWQAHWHNIVFYALGISTLFVTLLNLTGHSVHILSGHP